MADIRNRTTNSINDTAEVVLMHIQENYSQLMPHELLEQEDIVNEMIYNPHDPIVTVFYAAKELLEIYDITGTLYTKLQAAKIAYVILHSTGKFGLAIHKCNRMPESQKAWVRFKNLLRAFNQDLIETSYFTGEDAGMHHANMVSNVVAGLHEAL